MRSRLPPLFSLQCFEAAARLGTFTRAAAEIKLTPGAVSRQVRQLEDWCGLTLFARHGPAVRLTREGQDMLARMGGPLAALHTAVYPPPQDTLQTLQIATLASIAKAWLLPRLPDFQQRHPHVSLVVQTDYELARPAPRTAMVAIRHGAPPSGAVSSELLFEDRLIAVATPDMARQLGGQARDWHARHWLQQLTLDPRVWFDQAGLPAEFQAGGAAFNDADVLLDAAARGMGVALTRLSIAWPRLQTGALVLASTQVCRSPRDNWLIVRDDSRALPAVLQFCVWLRGQAAEWRLTLAGFDTSGVIDRA